MDISRMRAGLTNPRGPFPAEAMEWARDNAAQATPVLLSLLTVCTKAGDISDRELAGAFFALPVLAELREARAFPVLCALARNADRLDEIFEDFGAEYLHRLALALYEGDGDSLFDLAKDPAVDPLVRGSFLQAWCWHVLHRHADRKAACAAVAALRATIPADAAWLWFEWAQAMIRLDPDAAMPLVREVIGTGEIDGTVSDPQDYETDAAAWRDDPQGQRETWLTENAPVDDAVGLLLRWQQRVEESYDADDREEGDAPADEPTVNPFRDVGRNDPCPCGSGKKFKKCCLPAQGEP